MMEGFCGACERLEPLNRDGTVAPHTKWHAEFGRWHQVTCRGSGLDPTEPEETV